MTRGLSRLFFVSAALLAAMLLQAGGGGSDDALPTPPLVAYVANASGSVSAYTINANNGVLTSAGTFAAQANPSSVVVDRSGRYVYVANFASSTLSSYTINASTGALTVGPTYPTGVGTQPRALVVHPSNGLLYVANAGPNPVPVFSINPATGVLTSVGAPLGSGADPFAMAIEPGGKFLY